MAPMQLICVRRSLAKHPGIRKHAWWVIIIAGSTKTEQA